MQQRFFPNGNARTSAAAVHRAMVRSRRRPELVALGDAVRELRGRRRFSQEELGSRGDLHRNYVGAIERGEMNVTFRVLLKVARGLGVKLSHLILLYERNMAVPEREDR